MLDAYKELVPVVYGESSIKYLYSQAEADRMCFNMHWHDRMELNLVVSGSLNLHSDEGHFEVLPGQVVVSSPRRLHGGFAGSEGATYYTIMFEVEKFCNMTLASDKYLMPVAKGEVTFPRVVQNEQLKAALERLIGIVMDRTGHHPLMAEGIIYEIIGILYQYRTAPAKNVTEMNRGFKAILEYVNTNYTEKITPSEVSVRFGYNETYFCRRFKEVTGLTFTKYIQALRMEYAIKLLKEGKEEIRYIAWKCGYTDVSYFSNCFKKHFGFRPSELQ